MAEGICDCGAHCWRMGGEAACTHIGPPAPTDADLDRVRLEALRRLHLARMSAWGLPVGPARENHARAVAKRVHDHVHGDAPPPEAHEHQQEEAGMCVECDAAALAQLLEMHTVGAGASRDDLTDEQVQQARTLWGEGHSLSRVASRVGCSIFALSPWLYMEGVQRKEQS